uniref:Uncharacterized protein n=1 Tax=Plectus sambesii TaxID=2011161 RepID=A0A914W461_9BILA
MCGVVPTVQQWVDSQRLTTVICSDGPAPTISGHQQTSPQQPNGASPVRQQAHHRETTFGVVDDDAVTEHSWEVPQQQQSAATRVAPSTNGPLRSNGATMLVNGTPPQVYPFFLFACVSVCPTDC